MSLNTASVVRHLLRERVRLTAIALAVVRHVHDADDVVQQVIVAALEHPDRFRDPEHLSAWAFKAVRHRAIDLLRGRHTAGLDDAALDALVGLWAATPRGDTSARAEALAVCLKKLPGRHREVLRLRYDQGLSAEELAGRVHQSAGAVYQTLSRLHRKLRECVETRLGRPTPPSEATA